MERLEKSIRELAANPANDLDSLLLINATANLVKSEGEREKLDVPRLLEANNVFDSDDLWRQIFVLIFSCLPYNQVAMGHLVSRVVCKPDPSPYHTLAMYIKYLLVSMLQARKIKEGRGGPLERVPPEALAKMLEEYNDEMGGGRQLMGPGGLINIVQATAKLDAKSGGTPNPAAGYTAIVAIPIPGGAFRCVRIRALQSGDKASLVVEEVSVPAPAAASGVGGAAAAQPIPPGVLLGAIRTLEDLESLQAVGGRLLGPQRRRRPSFPRRGKRRSRPAAAAAAEEADDEEEGPKKRSRGRPRKAPAVTQQHPSAAATAAATALAAAGGSPQQEAWGAVHEDDEYSAAAMPTTWLEENVVPLFLMTAEAPTGAGGHNSLLATRGDDDDDEAEELINNMPGHLNPAANMQALPDSDWGEGDEPPTDMFWDMGNGLLMSRID